MSGAQRWPADSEGRKAVMVDTEDIDLMTLQPTWNILCAQDEVIVAMGSDFS